jgi:LytS/YehU family sensor histidine kinase
MDIREEDQARFIIKYAIQLLVENAQKHNIISKDVPLHIRISSDGERVTVANNLNLRLTQPESTGVGLKHIRQNYRERSGKDILIRETDSEYIVELPLL